MRSLDVYLYGAHVAELTLFGPQQYRLSYRDEWLDDPARMPLSSSLPLQVTPHTGDVLAAYLDNLLPDNPDVRERWAVDAGLDSTDPFGLLGVHGLDVAGAVQFVESGGDPLGGTKRRTIDEVDVADRIVALRLDDATWRGQDSASGYFSLGGAQGKFSLGWDGERWYEPTGADPTTHIFKPRVRGQVDGEIIEFLTMRLASSAGLPTAHAEIKEFGSEHSLVVQRFDRVAPPAASRSDSLVRIHTEDLAQATGTPRLRKYESRGGPGYRDALAVIDDHVPSERAARSREPFVKALVFSWIMLNTDAHAKNYSFFLTPSGHDLTPLYDVSSFIPYAGRDATDARELERAFASTQLSMRIAADYEAGQQSWWEWKAVAREAGIDRVSLTEWTLALVDGAADTIGTIVATLPTHLQSATVSRFMDRVPIRMRQVRAAIERSA